MPLLETLPARSNVETETDVVLSDPKPADGGPPFEDIFDDADGPRSICSWDDSVCTDTPTHCLVCSPWEEDGEPSEPVLYCARHFAATAAHFFTVHPALSPWCPVPVIDHFSYLGSIDNISAKS